MKKIFLTFCLNAFFNPFNYGQNFIHEFGKYSNEEFQLKRYEKDPSAEAVIIYDIGESHFEQSPNGFELVFERRTKIKIFDKAGLKWANFEIPLYQEKGDFEKLEELEGNTYNLETGAFRKAPLDYQKNSYVEKLNENVSLKKFAMPDVKEGSIVEIRYKIRSPYLFNFQSWKFQNKIPTIYSEYTAKMIPFYQYTYILQGTNKFDRFNKYEENAIAEQFGSIKYRNMVYEFAMNDVPAFKDESFITTEDDYIIKLNFQLSAIQRPDGTKEQIITTWPNLIEELLRLEQFGRYLKNAEKSAADIADTMNITPKPARTKAEILEKYVKLNFNWNGYDRKYSSKSVKDFLKTKTGNCADINLYLTGLLNAAGIKAYPVIISTRDNGKIPLDYPFSHFFNYVIVNAVIDNNNILLDATEPLCPFGFLPTRCLNDRGLVINKEKTQWLNFGGQSDSYIADSIDLIFNKTADTLKGSFYKEATGYDAIHLRKTYLKNKDDFKKEFTNDILSISDSLVTENLYDIDNPFLTHFNGYVKTETVDDKIFISPFCGMAISENPLKQPSRTYPVDMTYSYARSRTVTIHIPEGYKLLNKPVDLKVSNAQVSIIYKAELLDNNTLKVTGYYKFKKDVYQIAEYFFLRMYYTNIVDKFNEKIVIAKN
jgi:transglutaminase-like putative cysteine protease